MSDVLNVHILQVLDTIWIHSWSRHSPEVLPVRIRWVMRQHVFCLSCSPFVVERLAVVHRRFLERKSPHQIFDLNGRRGPTQVAGFLVPGSA